MTFSREALACVAGDPAVDSERAQAFIASVDPAIVRPDDDVRDDPAQDAQDAAEWAEHLDNVRRFGG